MRASPISEMKTSVLIDRFVEIAIAQNEALLYDDTSKYNRLYRQMDAIDKDLRRRGLDARLELTRLYSHPNLQVRLKAAIHTLAIAAEARKLLEAISQSGQLPQSLDAGMTLNAIDTGIFKPT